LAHKLKRKPKDTRRLLVAAVQDEIDRLQTAKKKLRSLDLEIIDRTIDAVESVAGAAAWLTSPAYGLQGKIPLDVAVTPKGRSKVLNLLGRIDHGILA
jgi:uncharacterized protein (DUF2384 family)